ncbi:MAG: gamma-butyrobetaine hydroxylase-like domain-containing protein [bacterium]
MTERAKPTDIILHSESKKLEISFDDGNRFEYPAEYLRVYSPSAEVRGHWGQVAKLEVDKQNVNITDIKPVGAYAIKIFFDDGHNSGLYDWDYLHDLGKKYAIYWSQYLERLHEAGHKR